MANTKSTKAGTVVKSIGADALKAIVKAFGTDDDTELSRVAIIEAAIIRGESQRGLIAAALKANSGRPIRGFSKGTVGRYWIVATALRRDDAPKLTDSQYRRVALSLATLANTDGIGAADVSAAVDLAIKGSTTGAQYATALATSARDAGKSAYRALTAPRKSGKRPVGGEAGDGGKQGKGKGAEAASPAAAAEVAAEAFKSLSTLAMVETLGKRLARVRTVDEAILSALTDVMSRVEVITGAAANVDA